VALLAVLFTICLAGPALAAAVTVTSASEKRGSVTPGLDKVLMQSISLRTDTGTTQFSAIKLNEFGSADAVATISAVKIYKETNGVARLQTSGASQDTLLSTNPSTYSSETNTFTFSTAQTLTTSLTVFYIVYDLKATAPTSTTIGSRLVDKNSITVSAGDTVIAFAYLQSREITVVSLPHGSVTADNPSPFSASTNLCQTCHAVHLAPNFEDQGLTGANATRRLLTQPYFESPAVVNNDTLGGGNPSDVYNALCFTCHDGTGSSTDIKSKYNGNARWAGHETKFGSSVTTGWKPPKTLPGYDAAVKMPCMVCHDVHTSSTTSYKMLADGLVAYAKGQGWQEEPDYVNNRVDNNNEMCLVCHRRPNETSRTASEVMGIDMTIVGHEEGQKSTDPCTNCHTDVHALDHN
jgi:hypothetical protein